MGTQRVYNDGSSSVGNQLQDFYYQKKALIELKKDQFFSPMADVTAMPKHFGKTIKRYHIMPLLDDRNVNDQGIDANGVIMAAAQHEVHIPQLAGNTPVAIEALEADFAAAHSSGDVIFITDSSQWVLLTADTAIAYDASTAGGASGTEKSDAEIKAYIEDTLTGTPSVTATVVNNSITVDNQNPVYATEAKANIVEAIIAGASKAARYGNLYGSSKDVGVIAAKLPALSETGGRVNRVGFKRIEIEGTLEKFGFFDEYTQESLDFDTDSELKQHVNREMLRGANEMTEDALQIDLLSSPGVYRFSGIATSKATMSGETGSICEVTYGDFSALSIELDDNRCPKETKIISGTRMVDTRVIPASRAMFIGSEMIPTIERLKDHFDNQAFIPVAHYAAGTKILNGEIGTVGQFRIVVVPEMMHWAGAGAAETVDNAGYLTTNGRYNVYPMMVIGSESFTTIGFQTSGKNSKFRIFHKKPGYAVADSSDPFGETGFMSIKWYYGYMALRTERLAMMYSVARQ